MIRLLLLFTAFLSSLPTWAGEKLIPMSASQRKALGVVTGTLSNQPGAVASQLPARVVVPPAQERMVAAPVAGVIAEVRVAVGDAVRAGQPLAVLRGEGLVAAQRDLTQAAVQARLAEETAQRDEALFKEGIIAESRLQGARATLAQTRAALAERRAWLRLMGLSGAVIQAAESGNRYVDSVALAAPAAGSVVEQQAVVGARVEAGISLFKVVRLDPLWLDIQVPAEAAAAVKPGQKVELPEHGVSGAVTLVGRSVSAAQTVSLRARVNNPDGRLRLNQNVSVRLAGNLGGRQWQLASAAVASQAGRNWVFVERAGGFEPVPVSVVARAAQAVTLTGPFAGNERIAVQGVAALKSAWQGGGE